MTKTLFDAFLEAWARQEGIDYKRPHRGDIELWERFGEFHYELIIVPCYDTEIEVSEV